MTEAEGEKMLPQEILYDIVKDQESKITYLMETLSKILLVGDDKSKYLATRAIKRMKG